MMHLDRNALDGFLKDVGAVSGEADSWGVAPALAPALGEAEEVPIPFVVDGNAGPSTTAASPAEEEPYDPEEQTGGYALMVIEGAASAPSAPSAQEAQEAPSAQEAQEAQATLEERVEEAETTERVFLPRRRRWPLMAAAGMAVAGLALVLALLIERPEHSVPATEKATQGMPMERAPVASAPSVPIPEPAPMEAAAVPPAAPVPQAEETNREMRFPGIFDRNSSHPHDIDAVALGDMVRLLRAGCAGGSIRITGHTCTLGDAHSNQELSLLRARRVGELLVRAGFSPEQLRLVGQGDRQPIADNHVSGGLRQNRRVTLSCDPNPQDDSRQLGSNTPGSRQRTPEEEAR